MFDYQSDIGHIYKEQWRNIFADVETKEWITFNDRHLTKHVIKCEVNTIQCYLRVKADNVMCILTWGIWNKRETYKSIRCSYWHQCSHEYEQGIAHIA